MPGQTIKNYIYIFVNHTFVDKPALPRYLLEREVYFHHPSVDGIRSSLLGFHERKSPYLSVSLDLVKFIF